MVPARPLSTTLARASGLSFRFVPSWKSASVRRFEERRRARARAKTIFLVSIQFALKCLVLSVARLDYPSRLRILKAGKNEGLRGLFSVLRESGCPTGQVVGGI